MLLIALVATMAFGPATPEAKGCTPVQTRALIVRFVRAFNQGDARTLNQVWDSRDWFKWYSVSNEPGIRIKADAYRRDTLRPYFAARHAAHERLVLTSVRINTSGHGYRNFEYGLMRSADDLPGGPVAYYGKGASSCFTGRLDVWSMGVR